MPAFKIDALPGDDYGAPYFLPRPPPAPDHLDDGKCWTDHARCKGMPTELFFPNRYNKPSASAEAIAVCDDCPVTVECRDYADRNNLKHGVWGAVPESTRMPTRTSGRRKRKSERNEA